MEVTPEMRQAVREEKCAIQGHSFDTVCSVHSRDPVRIVCTNCGRSWKVAG